MGKLTAFDNGWIDYGLMIMKRVRHIRYRLRTANFFNYSSCVPRGKPWKAQIRCSVFSRPKDVGSILNTHFYIQTWCFLAFPYLKVLY